MVGGDYDIIYSVCDNNSVKDIKKNIGNHFETGLKLKEIPISTKAKSPKRNSNSTERNPSPIKAKSPKRNSNSTKMNSNSTKRNSSVKRNTSPKRNTRKRSDSVPGLVSIKRKPSVGSNLNPNSSFVSTERNSSPISLNSTSSSKSVSYGGSTGGSTIKGDIRGKSQITTRTGGVKKGWR